VGTDVFKLNYDAATARFSPSHVSCIPNGPGGSHTATIHPSGDWLAISNPGDRSIDIVDLRKLDEATFENKPPIIYRIIDATYLPKPGEFNSRCPAGATFKCIVARDPSGAPATQRNDPNDTAKITKGCETTATGSPPPAVGAAPAQTQFCFRPHDVFFSKDGKTAYCACLNSTFVMDVSRALEAGLENDPNPFPTLSIIENRFDPPGEPDSANNISLSHQADTTPDEKILVVSDERGGGTNEMSCQHPGGLIGALHFFALAPIQGVPASADASKRNPVKLGVYVNPSPLLPPDAMARTERGCTVHVFRIGGNGAGSPGEGANQGLGGVSTIGSRQLVTAWYGAAVWYIDFSAPPDTATGDTVKEDGQTTWGNTLAYNIQTAADTWSAKEYKGGIFAGDLARGFDTYKIQRTSYEAPGFTPGVTSAPGGPAGVSCRDQFPPRSTLKPRGLKRRGDRISLRGRSRDQGCRKPGTRARAAGKVSRVHVSIARIQRNGCRFLSRDGTLASKARSCNRPTLLRARGTARWRFSITASLPSGSYRAVVRARDRAGNKERPRASRNVIRFKVR
jgi:hypothetical protein